MNPPNKTIFSTFILITVYTIIGTAFLKFAGLSFQLSFGIGVLFGYLMDILVSIYGVMCDIKRSTIEQNKTIEG